MKKISKELVQELANGIMIELTNDEAELIVETEKHILERLDKIRLIDTENVKPLHYAYEGSNTFLKEDEDFEVISKESVLKNAPSSEGDFITIKKVVK